MEALTVFLAEYFIYVVAAFVGVYWLLQSVRVKVRLVVLGAVGGGVALLLSLAANTLFYDPRPFVVQHFTPLFSHIADNGFPSDHTTVLALASFCVFVLSRPIGVALFVCTVAVGWARVAAGVHSPLDIVGSIVIAGIGAVVGYWVERRLGPRIEARFRVRRGGREGFGE